MEEEKKKQEDLEKQNNSLLTSTTMAITLMTIASLYIAFMIIKAY